MALAAGTRLGPYEVLAPLGTGGMGEVYRARDTKLQRDVALKVLPDAFASDPDRLARFEREAKTLAALNHPHIAHIHGLDDSGDRRALVIELVEGPTLAERIARGPLPLDEALPIARQLAEALEYAHEHGIVHRDLKPTNIKLTPDGAVKVLDFGLARALEGGPSGADPANSPTITSPAMTRAGVILGTAAYMSPEQARGATVDKRADIWAFGVVLFEMLAGRQCFGGDTVSETLAGVLRAEPDWATLPSDTPSRVRDLLRRCLAKDRRQRLHDIGDARLELEFADTGPDASATTQVRRSKWKTPPLTGALGLATGAVLMWAIGLSDNPATLPEPVTRFSQALPERAPLQVPTVPGSALAISRDGRQLIYRAGLLQLRRLSELTVRDVPETQGALNPFFSPDGEWVAFFTAEGMLKKVSLRGGRAVILARGLSSAMWLLGSWSDDGRIVFDGYTEGLRVVPAGGGAVTTLTKPSGEWHRDPQVLPGSDVVLYQAQALTRFRIEAISLDANRRIRKTILEEASRPCYVASGHLMFMRDGGLMIAPFDRDRLEVAGPATAVPLQLAIDDPNVASPVPQLAVSLEGTLTYVPFPAERLRSSALVWIDRRGQVEDAANLPFAHPYFGLSPDGGQLIVTGREAGRVHIDLYDLSRKVATRLVDWDVAEPTGQVFSADGRRVFLGRCDMERCTLFSLPVAGGGDEERILTVPGNALLPTSASPDGRYLAFYVFDRSGDVWVADLQAPEDRRARPFLATPNEECCAAFSPDGRFLAYSSTESGDFNVYVQRFPQGDAKTRVSTNGGISPQWSRDGTELFYQSGDGGLLVVPVRKDGGLRFGTPQVVFEGPYLLSSDFGSTYAVSPDARRFLMTRQPNLVPLRASEIVVVQNWFEELKAKVPSGTR